MSFDAWIVAFGLSKLIRDLGMIETNSAFLVLAGVIVLDAWLLYRFFAQLDEETGAVTPAPAVAYGRPPVVQTE